MKRHALDTRLLLTAIALTIGLLHSAPLLAQSPNDQLQEAAALLRRVRALKAEGRSTEAIPLAQQSLNIVKQVLGPDHAAVATALANLATLLQDQGDCAQALPLLEQAVTIIHRELGDDHPNMVATLNNLALVLQDLGRYREALKTLEKALLLARQVLGQDAPGTGTVLNSLAGIQRLMGSYAVSEQLLQESLTIRNKLLGPTDPATLLTLNNLGVLFQEQGASQKAEPILRKVLALRRQVMGETHLEVADSLNALGELHRDRSELDQAESLFLQAAKILRTALGDMHPRVAMELNYLAELKRQKGAYFDAERLLRQALEILEKRLGHEHPSTASILHSLAALHLDRGEYGQAEALARDGLQTMERVKGKDHPERISYLHLLSLIHLGYGEAREATQLSEEALQLAERALGPEHPDLVRSLNNLGELYRMQGDLDRADGHLQRAVKVWQATGRGKSAEQIKPLNNLALVYIEKGKWSEAEKLLRRALALCESALGKAHPDVAMALINLSAVAYTAERYREAEPLLRRALQMLEGAFGPRHPNALVALNNLATLLVTTGRLSAALPLFWKVLELGEGLVAQVAQGAPESRLEIYLSTLRAMEEGLFTLAQLHPQDQAVQRLALTAVLLRKGRTVDYAGGLAQARWQGLSAEDQRRFAELRELQGQLAVLVLSGPGQTALPAFRRKLEETEAHARQLEGEIALHSAAIRARQSIPEPARIVAQIAAALPADSALIEVVNFQPFLFKATGNQPRWDEPRYLAFVLLPSGQFFSQELGTAALLDDAAARLLTSLRSDAEDPLPAALVLHEKLVRPLLPRMGERRHLLWSLDGQLQLVPMMALHDGKQYLADRYLQSYLTSGRDLLRSEVRARPGAAVTLMADPAWSGSKRDARPGRRDGELLSLLAALPPLPGSRREAMAIKRLLPQARLLVGADASEAALQQQDSPSILHVATHGLFLQDQLPEESAQARLRAELVGMVPPRRFLARPLLRSALVLAPSPQAGSGVASADGLLTALELTGINLWSTKLVVFSACDTARGAERRGQGVYGLRRAALVAGAETLVASLWKVNDDATEQLMTAYYQQLLAGKGRADAMQQAAAQIRAHHPHPYFWAPFIVIGKDTPLIRQ